MDTHTYLDIPRHTLTEKHTLRETRTMTHTHILRETAVLTVRETTEMQTHR